MKNLLTLKNVCYLILILVIGILVQRGLKYLDATLGENQRLHAELIGKTQAYEQLSASTAKLEIKYKTQEDLRKEAEKRFKNEIGSMENKIKILADATFLIKEKARETSNSDIVFNGENAQYILNEIRFENGPPVGYVLIFKDGRVVSKIYNHQIKIDTAVSKNEETGRYVVVSKADFILKSASLNPDGKVWTNQPYALKIIGGSAQIDPTEPVMLNKRFHLWNPKANLNLNADPGGIYPGMGVSLMSYGYTKNDLDYRFLQLGAQYQDRTAQPTFIPVLWRPFNSLMSNTYIGPGINLKGLTVNYFISVQVGL